MAGVRSQYGVMGGALVVACVLVGGAARADDVSTRAHEAYDRGVDAFKRGEYGVAARAFAEADALVPSATALHAALDAAVRADDPVLGTELLARTSRARADEALDATIRAARARFARRTGRVKVACATECHATLDGVAVDVGVAVVVRIGAHAVTIDAGGAPERRSVDVAPDDTVVVSPMVPGAPVAPAPLPAAPHATGLSPAWFYVGAGLTAAAGSLAIASAIDTSNKHSDFLGIGCNRVGNAGCTTAASDGSSAQTRTNVLVGTTAALGVASAALAIFAVRWRSDAAVTVGMVQGAPGASLRLSFR